MLTIEEGGEEGPHRWLVWDGREARPIGPAFVPSPAFLRDYAPFYGQFTQAMTPWSPDGASFAFAGLIGHRNGIWVQDLDAAEPHLRGRRRRGGGVVARAHLPADRRLRDRAE